MQRDTFIFQISDFNSFGFFKLPHNVSLLELVAAYGKLFFHNRPSEVMKTKRTIYRKTSHKF